MYELNDIINAFTTMFVIVDPIGLAPIFLAVTQGATPQQQKHIGVRAMFIALILLFIFLFAGQLILQTLGITIHAFRVAGGLLLFYTAFEMVFGSRNERKSKAATSDSNSHAAELATLAVFPLALPLIAGPGAISATILLSQEHAGFEWQLILIGIITFVMLLVLLAFYAAQAIDKYLGDTGRTLLTRLLGVLLSALSVQFAVDGLKALWA